jgi:putative nucleotidyltransferase with HDIG domain
LLVARVLQVANSAFYMRRNPVDNLGNALAYLGLEGIRQVLVQLIFHNLATKYFANQQEKLLHSECCAYLAVKLGERKTRDVFTLGKIRVAGLLHDLGALALQFCFPDEYVKATELIRTRKNSTIMAERAIFGTDHCEVGARLCEEWKLPEYVKKCAADHHGMFVGKDEKLILPVICANAFLNNEIDQLPGMDYGSLAASFALNTTTTENEGKIEVMAFLYETYKGFKAQQGKQTTR